MPDNYKTFTKKDLDNRFRYDPEIGDLVHKKGNFIGRVAGSSIKSNGGYIYLSVGRDGKTYSLLAHKVVWLMCFGKGVEDGKIIDHIDGDPTNNRIANLREVTHKEKSRNKGPRVVKHNSRYVLTSVTGIKFDKQEMCYVVTTGSDEICRTLDFDDAKYTRWNWEFDNNYTERA